MIVAYHGYLSTVIAEVLVGKGFLMFMDIS